MSERDGEDEKEEENKRTDPRVGHIMNYTLKSFKVSVIGVSVITCALMVAILEGKCVRSRVGSPKWPPLPRKKCPYTLCFSKVFQILERDIEI